jgi:hypothetical protein
MNNEGRPESPLLTRQKKRGSALFLGRAIVRDCRALWRFGKIESRLEHRWREKGTSVDARTWPVAEREVSQ